jgi:hypothetical protein
LTNIAAFSAAAYFFFLGDAGASTLHMLPDSLQAGHFFGLQRVSTFSPHFSQVKTAMGHLQISLNHQATPLEAGGASPPMRPWLPYNNE